MPQLKSYWLETCRVHKPIRYFLTTLLYPCDVLVFPQSFTFYPIFYLFFAHFSVYHFMPNKGFFTGSNHTMRSCVCFLSLHDSMMGLPATMPLSMSFPWRIFSHIWIHLASDDRLSIVSKISHWHHRFIAASPVLNYFFSFRNDTLCRDSSKHGKHALLHRHTMYPPIGMKFKGIFHFYCFTLSIIKITAPEKTAFFLKLFLHWYMSPGAGPGSPNTF